MYRSSLLMSGVLFLLKQKKKKGGWNRDDTTHASYFRNVTVKKTIQLVSKFSRNFHLNSNLYATWVEIAIVGKLGFKVMFQQLTLK